MELIFEHEKALAENQIPLEEYPIAIKNSIKSLKALLAKYVNKVPEADRDPQKIIDINVMSAKIADDMQTFYEECQAAENDDNQNLPNMLTGKELERATAVGLDANATIEQVIAEETKIAEAAQQAKAAEEALAERAKAVGLSVSATLEEIEAAESAKAAEELKARALAAGLVETATLAEIEEAESAQAEDAAAKKKNPDPPAPDPAPAKPAKPRSVVDDVEDFFL